MRPAIKPVLQAHSDAPRDDTSSSGGRPAALSKKNVAAARAMLSDPDITMEDVAARMKVAPSTLY